MTRPSKNTDVVLREVPPDWFDDLFAGASLPDGDSVVFLPDAIQNGVASFPADLLDTVKTLKNDGVDASFFAAPNGRTFRSQYSADPALIVGILVNIFSNGAYDAIKLTFQRLRQRLSAPPTATTSQEITLRMKITETPDGKRTFQQDITGPAEAVLSRGEDIGLQIVDKLFGPAAESSGRKPD